MQAATSSDGSSHFLHTGEYGLAGDITSYLYIWITEWEEVVLDLNGYVWDMGSKNIISNGLISVYDISDNGEVE